jgi:NADH-quinone oxidoreductase subunit M
MILAWLIAIPFAGGIAAWLAGRQNPRAPQWTALAALIVSSVMGLALLIPSEPGLSSPAAPWWFDLQAPWIPAFGIHFHLACDGLSVALILLTHLLGLAAVLCSWNEAFQRPGFFYFNLLWVIAGLIGVFTALDLFLFYMFWEMMMVPMFFMIAVWGHEHRIYAAIKFFLFTQVGGLLMLAAIVALYLIHGRATGTYTFEYMELVGTRLEMGTAMWLMLGFLAAFAVKLPAFPVHSWLPDAHTEAPTAGSILLAGVMLKTGAYGMLRFVVPLFPEAARAFAPLGMALGVVGIIYGAVLAFSQTDLKRLVAYTSISHMGFVMLAVFAWNELALQGAVIQMICHGIGTGALFAIVGMLQERLQTRDLRRMGGLWEAMPRMGAATLLFALAALGLPGLGNFVGEFLILFGAFAVSPVSTILAAFGLVAATVYALWIMQKAFFGRLTQKNPLRDLSAREGAVLAVLALMLVWLGLYPQPAFNLTRPALTHLRDTVPIPVQPADVPISPGRPGKRIMAISVQGDGDATH